MSFMIESHYLKIELIIKNKFQERKLFFLICYIPKPLDVLFPSVFKLSEADIPQLSVTTDLNVNFLNFR